jgi:glycosyltransferase involved in cell wall biosynthesis
MKILILATTFPVNSIDRVPRFVENQIINLKNSYPDLEFIVLAPDSSKFQILDESKYYKQIRFKYFWPNKMQTLTNGAILNQLKDSYLNYLLVPFLVVSQIFHLVKLVKKESPDLIYAHWFFPQAISAFIASKIYKIPYVFTSHSSDLEIVDKKIPIIGKLIIKKICKEAKSISTPSKKVLEIIESFFNKEELMQINTHVIPMGINTRQIVTSKNHTKSLVKRILFIGRFSEKKGVEILIKSFDILTKKYRQQNLELILAGDGEEKDNYLRLTESLNLQSKVKFVGFVDEDTKYQLLYSSDLLVVPSVKGSAGDVEGLPVVIIEGLYCRLPVLASIDTNAQELITHFENGFIISDVNPNNLSKQIAQIFELSSEELLSICDSGYETAKNFDSQNNARSFYELLICSIT